MNLVDDRKKDFSLLFLMKNKDSYVFTSESNYNQMKQLQEMSIE